MIPLRDQNPAKKTPIVNRLLIVANILVWIYVLTLVRQPGAIAAFYDRYSFDWKVFVTAITQGQIGLATFALAKPLPIAAKSIVALTVPTWAPAFAVNLGTDQAWRSSRNPAKCNDVQQFAAHQTVGSSRQYTCFYRTARLLYSATYIPDPTPTTPTKKK